MSIMFSASYFWYALLLSCMYFFFFCTNFSFVITPHQSIMDFFCLSYLSRNSYDFWRLLPSHCRSPLFNYLLPRVWIMKLIVCHFCFAYFSYCPSFHSYIVLFDWRTDISQKHFVQYIYLTIPRCFILNSHLVFHAFHHRLFYSFQAFECKHKVLMILFVFHEEIYVGWFLVVAVMEMLCTSFACRSSVCDRQSNFVHVVQSD